MTDKTSQAAHWQRVRYRGPTDPVVVAYATPKLDCIESVLPLRGRSMLDVGCGPGVFTHHLLQRGAQVVAADISMEMLARVEGTMAVAANAAALPFPVGSFDLAFAANLLHHAMHPLQVVCELARVARGGVAIIEPNRLNPIMAAFSALVPAERGGLRSSRRYLAGLLRSAGLRPARFCTIGMISQNNTPAALVPILRWFDFDFFLGQYHVVVAFKDPPTAPTKRAAPVP